MKITGLHTDDAVLAELGARIASRRIELQLTQTEMDEQKGIKKHKLERIKTKQKSKNYTGGLVPKNKRVGSCSACRC